MNEKKRRAIVWDTIERIAFRPGTDRARDAWLGVYTKTLHAPSPIMNTSANELILISKTRIVFWDIFIEFKD